MATINKTTVQNVPTLLVVLMVIAMQRYDTAPIAQWRRFMAYHHRASTCSDITNWTRQHRLFLLFHCEKGLSDMLAPNKKRGMTYQTDEKHKTNLQEYFVGVVKLASYYLNTHLLLCVFTNKDIKILVKCYVQNSLATIWKLSLTP